MIGWILSFFLLGTQALDFDMSRDEQKKTGVYKLSEKQKRELQSWIDTHYAKREQPTQSNYSQDNPTLQENLQSGRYLRLSDQSLWEIDRNDTPLTQGWITPVEIIVSQSGDSRYPYKLTNSLTGSSVKARKAGSVPKNR